MSESISRSSRSIDRASVRPLLTACLLIAMTTGCVSEITLGSLIPADCDVRSERFDSLVFVKTEAIVRPFDTLEMVDEYMVGDALAEAIRRTRLFRGVGTRKTAGYALLVSLQMKHTGGGRSTEVIGEWSLEDLRTGVRQYKEVIHSEGTASIGETLAGSKRLSTERAIGKNICEGLAGLSKMDSSLP